VFFKGCPLKCIWCSNPEGQSYQKELRQIKTNCIGCNECIKICPVNAIDVQKNINRKICISCGKCAKVCFAGALEIVGYEMSTEEILVEVEKDMPFYTLSGGGVTLSGGEPTGQPEFAISILRECRKKGIHTAIETCGYTEWDNLERIANYTDVILYDIKHINSQVHKKLTGKFNEKILKNLKLLSNIKDIEIIVRIPVIKPYNNQEAHIKEISKFLGSLGRKLEIELLPYFRYGISKYKQIGKFYKASGAQSPTITELSLLVKIFKKYHFKVGIQGVTKKEKIRRS